MSEQQRKLLNGAVAITLLRRKLEGNVVVAAESLEADRVTTAPFPFRQRITNEGDMLPEVPYDTSRGARRDLDPGVTSSMTPLSK